MFAYVVEKSTLVLMNTVSSDANSTRDDTFLFYDKKLTSDLLCCSGFLFTSSFFNLGNKKSLNEMLRLFVY